MSVAVAHESAGACVDDNTLGELVEGRLSADRRAAVDEHLARCAECRRIAAVAMSSGLSGVRNSERALPAGARVGRYVVGERVGAGAMGTVYAAHDPDLDRQVALKVMRRRSGGEELRARLLREGQAMARLTHPGVITVYDVGTVGDQLFVAMELVTGGTLRHWTARRSRDWREVLDVFRRAGAGLACAHAAGLVHRDFKPDNVLVGDDGRVRVTDFGLARATRDESGDAAPPDAAADPLEATLTRTGSLVGTPAYMAPEQLRGAAVDARADVFSFCVSLYEALYGDRPFAGTTLVALRDSIERGAVRPAPRGSGVPRRLRRALLVGLRADPGDRYASMDTLLRALDEAVPARRTRTALVAVAALASVAAAAWWYAPRATPSASPPSLVPSASIASRAVTAPPPAAPVAAAEPPGAFAVTPSPGSVTPAAPTALSPSRADQRARARAAAPPAANGPSPRPPASATEPRPIVIE
jgi:serine/threonine protein kinase